MKLINGDRTYRIVDDPDNIFGGGVNPFDVESGDIEYDEEDDILF